MVISSDLGLTGLKLCLPEKVLVVVRRKSLAKLVLTEKWVRQGLRSLSTGLHLCYVLLHEGMYSREKNTMVGSGLTN
jgi:hypothetical protein